MIFMRLQNHALSAMRTRGLRVVESLADAIACHYANCQSNPSSRDGYRETDDGTGET
jgi:hypothetical protein